MTNINNIINDKNDKQWQNGDEMTKKRHNDKKTTKWQKNYKQIHDKNDKY